LSKLSSYKQNLGQNILSQFPNLGKNVVTEEEWLKYCLHVETLLKDMKIHSADLVDLWVPSWILTPFSAKPETYGLNFKSS